MTMRRGTWFEIGAVVLVATSAFAWLHWSSENAASDAGPPPTPVTVEIVARGDVPIELNALGRVQAPISVTVRAQVAGQLQKVVFQQGQPVRPGQLLAQIDPRPFQATVEQDRATLARDRANLANAEADLSRYIPLVPKGLVSVQQVDTQRALVAQLKATIAADQAAIARDQLQLGYTSIAAPVAGVAGLRLVDVGNVVSPSDPQGLVVINQVQPIAVLFSVPQIDLPEIRTRAAEAGKDGLAVQAWSQDDAHQLDSGRLSVINNQVDAASGTLTLQGMFPNARELLWPGMFVTVRLVLEVQHDGLTVPSAALQQGPKGAFVWTVARDGTAHPAPVRVQQSQHGRVLVSSGLSPGEQVVTDGQYGLTSGAHVAIQRSGAQQASGEQPVPALHNAQTDRLGIVP
jgi:membrane fusion protein, multidrug efflux system